MNVIDPNDIEPTINPASAEHRDGRQVHRRILSAMRGGPGSIDIGYNRSVAGLDYAVPYAYNRDEYCYTAAGSARMQSSGETVDFVAGQFMWRPAGAVTHRFTVTSAYNSICAFGPARIDAWSHLLPKAEIEAHDGSLRPQFRNVSDAKPLEGTDQGVTHRVIFDTPFMEVSHIMLSQGAQAHLSQPARDQVYFLENGSLLVSNKADSRRVREHQFLIVGAEQRFDMLAAEQDCIIVRWSAPDARDQL